MYWLSLCNDRADIPFWCFSQHPALMRCHSGDWDPPSDVLAQTIPLMNVMPSYWPVWYQHYSNGLWRGLLVLGNYMETFSWEKSVPVVPLFNMQQIRVVHEPSAFLDNKNELISQKQPSPITFVLVSYECLCSWLDCNDFTISDNYVLIGLL